MFKQGISGNPKGRPKGAKGKASKDVKALLAKIVSDNIPSVQRDLSQLEPKERLIILEKLMAYVIPKATTTQNNINVDKLTEEQINQIIESL